MEINLHKKIKNKSAIVGVIGIGYVGLPLCVAAGNSGFKVIGLDIDVNKVKSINKGISYIEDIKDKEINMLVREKIFYATNDFSELKKCNIVCICVPTPLTKTKDPDLYFVNSATKKIKENLQKEQLIILESTTYPGTTEEVLRLTLEKNNLKVGKDFYLGFSPERIDPGNKDWTIKNTPKIVSGITSKCKQLVYEFYSCFVDKVVVVSDTKVAETAKLLENVFRSVNIALVNELALLCGKMKINVWEVIEAASTKPYGFMKFYPGPGLGGHCIPIDPFYFSWKAKEYDLQAKFVELSGEINSQMPYYVVHKIFDAANYINKSISNTKILILGVSYKKDIGDMRESPAVKVMKILLSKNCDLEYIDPYVPELILDEKKLKSKPMDKYDYSIPDIVAILSNHSIFPYDRILKHSKTIVDTRGVYWKNKNKKIFSL